MSPKHVRLMLYLDENFPVPAGMFLKKQRHSVFFTLKLSKGCSDEAQIKTATKNNRILVSLDKDFQVNEKLKGFISKSPGVILISCSQTDSNNIIKIINKQIHTVSPIEIKGKICRISIDKSDVSDT